MHIYQDYQIANYSLFNIKIKYQKSRKVRYEKQDQNHNHINYVMICSHKHYIAEMSRTDFKSHTTNYHYFMNKYKIME